MSGKPESIHHGCRCSGTLQLQWDLGLVLQHLRARGSGSDVFGHFAVPRMRQHCLLVPRYSGLRHQLGRGVPCSQVPRRPMRPQTDGVCHCTENEEETSTKQQMESEAKDVVARVSES